MLAIDHFKSVDAAALAAGCDAYLLKPVSTRELSDQLTAVAERGDAIN